MLVERAPLPPHERAWRHPSELAAADHAALSSEGASSTSRTIALVGGAAGMLAIALLVLTVAPRRSDTPTAVSSTSGPGSPVQVAPASLGLGVGDVADVAFAALPLATPIGDDGLALTTSRAIAVGAADDVMIDVELPTGHIARALVVDRGESGGIAWLSLGDGAFEEGLDMARRTPRADDIVTVLADPPMLIEFSNIAQVDAADGTPVVDDEGDVVGLCVDRDDSGEARFTPIDELVGDATNDDPD